MLEYLKQHEVKEGPYNFQSKEYYRKYLINDLDEFWNLYEEYIKENECYLMEHPNLLYSNVRIDVDIQNNNNTKGRLYTKEDIYFIISNLNRILSNIVLDKKCTTDFSKFISVIMEKDNYGEKDGFHIIYPYLFFLNKYQNNSIVKDLNETLEKNNKDFMKVDSIATKPWVLLGSKKDKKSFIYKITEILDVNLEKKDINISARDLSVNKKQTVYYGLPSYNEIIPSIKKVRDPLMIKKDIDLLIKYDLLNNLSYSRVENYDEWLDIGITLYNIGEGSDECLDLWISFSKRSISKFKEGVCEEKWKSFKLKGRTIRTLFWWLNKDNAKYFCESNTRNFRDNVHNLIFANEDEATLNDEELTDYFSSWNLQNYHLATLFYKKHFNRYVFAIDKDVNKGEWYEFINNRWKKINKTDIHFQIRQMESDTIKFLQDLKNDKEGCQIIGLAKVFNKFISRVRNKFGDYTFIENTVKAAGTFFKNYDFLHKVDSNVFLIGCENGVLDFTTENFRQGTPDDFITYSTGINYYHSNKDKEQEEELMEYFTQMFPDEIKREFALDFFSTLLLGENKNKLLVSLIGKADSGKSSLVSFFETSFGDYCIKFPKEVLTQRSSSRSSGAKPELARAKGRRLVFIQETSEGDTIDSGTMKEMTGNDTFFARGLYKAGEDIKPTFTLILVANNPPKGEDEASWGRIKILDCESKFTVDAPKDYEEQMNQKRFPLVLKKNERLRMLSSCFLRFLFQRCIAKRFHKGNPIIIPDCVNLSTTKVINDNDQVYNYFHSRITIDKELGKFESVTRLYDDFKYWYEYNYNKKTKKNRQIFRGDFIKISGLETVKDINEGSTAKVEGWRYILKQDK